MELNRKSVFIPIWFFELKSKGKWVYTDNEEGTTESVPESDVQTQFYDFFESELPDGVIYFAHGRTEETDKFDSEDACEIIAKASPKSEPIRYLYTTRGKEEEVQWIALFRLRTRTFPPKLYAD